MLRNRVTAILLIAGAVLANVAFAGLGTVFNYPDILQAPPNEILAEFKEHQVPITLWFAVLAVASAILAPIAILLRRLYRGSVGRVSVWLGVTAAVVQVVGLSRWFLFVPNLAKAGDIASFQRLHTILGTIVGETIGYVLTSAWTLLIARDFGRRMAGPWFSWMGYASAILIILGVFIPFGIPGVDFANFIGYVVWSIWLIAFGVILWRAPRGSAYDAVHSSSGSENRP